MTFEEMLRSHRIAGWFDKRVLPLLAGLALLVDAMAGVVLLLAPRSEFDSAVYRAAFTLMGPEAWGVLLLALTAVTALTWWVQGRCRLAGFWLTYALGAGYWMFWTILGTWSAIGLNGASGLAAVLAAALGGVHVLAGVAWPSPTHEHRKSET